MIARRGQQALLQWEGLILSQARFIASGRRPRPSASPSTPPQPAQQQQQQQQNLPAVPQEQWTEVVHQQTGQVYYWNERTGETTALGEPKPGPEGRVQQPRRVVQQGTSLVGLVGVGAGIGLVFALLGRIF